MIGQEDLGELLPLFAKAKTSPMWPSVQDLKNDFKQRLNGYIATPGGRVWFNDYNNQISRLLCDIGCIETDPNYRECKHTAPEAQYTIEGLKWRGKTVNTPC